MALDKATLQSTLETIFKSEHTAAEAAQKIADAIDAYVKTAEVKVTAAIGEISVQGSATAQANAKAIPITGNPTSKTGGLS